MSGWYWDFEAHVTCWEQGVCVHSTEQTAGKAQLLLPAFPLAQSYLFCWFKPIYGMWRTTVFHLCGGRCLCCPSGTKPSDMQGIVTSSRAEGQTVTVENNFCHQSAIQQSLSDRALRIRNSFMVRKVNLTSSAPRAVRHRKKLFKPTRTWVVQSKAAFRVTDRYLQWRKMVCRETGCFQGINSSRKWKKTHLTVQEKLLDSSILQSS